MWPSGFNKLSWEEEPHKCVSIVKDSAGFFMHPHIDNREVIGVLIVNLHDNPKVQVLNLLITHMRKEKK